MDNCLVLDPVLVTGQTKVNKTNINPDLTGLTLLV